MTDMHHTIRALVKFDMSNNELCAAGSKALAEALTGNQIMTELNIASNYMGAVDGGTTDLSGIIAIGDAIPTMGALTSLDLASNELGAAGAKHVAEAIKVNVSALRFD